MIAFARQRYLAIYKVKLDIDATLKRSNVSATLACGTSLAGLAADEKITALVCLPLVSQQKSNEGAVDWTAIVIGFNTGFIRVYTESGQLLLAQKLHDEPVSSIKCSSFYSPASNGKRVHTNEADQLDEITVTFSRIVLIVEGFAFYQTIRAARNHFARLRTGEDAIRHVLDAGINLPFKKWNFRTDEPTRIEDCTNGGPRTRNLYDYFVSQSINSDHAAIRQHRPLSNLIVTTGDNPFLGFYDAFEVRLC